ncbi:MAG: NfeD family protein [Thermodesulfobacteriota bacterium]
MRSRPLALVIWGSVLLAGLAGVLQAAPEGGGVPVMYVSSAINPVTAEFIEEGLKKAAEQGAPLAVIQLDTPGGLDTAMREIVKFILASEVPVVVYVAPSGARAASAGVFITMAADVAAMAPGTNIGAAHPVAMGGKDMAEEMAKKVENDAVAYIKGIASKRGRNADWAEKAVRESVSIPAEEALQEKVIDVMAQDLSDLLRQLHGRVLERPSGQVTIDVQGLPIEHVRMGWRQRLLDALSNPNVAYLLMMIGLAGLYFELAHPGAIFPGVIGAISLILAFYALHTLPVNYAGIILIVLGVIFFILELKVSSFGLLTVAGVISLVLGSIMLFSAPGAYQRLTWGVLIPTVVVVSGFFAVVAALAFRAYMRKPEVGSKAMIGQVGEAMTRLDPRGKVFVRGEIWNAMSDEVIESGEKVEVVEIQGLNLKVKKA